MNEVSYFVVQEFAQSVNAYDNLGEVYLKAGDGTQAIKNYKEAMELNPDLETVKEASKTLGTIE